MRHFTLLTRVLFAVLVIAFFAACEENDGYVSSFYTQTAKFADGSKSYMAWYTATQREIQTSGDPDTSWTATIAEDGQAWCSFSATQPQFTASGTTRSATRVYISENLSDETRTTTITVTFDDAQNTSVTLTITQNFKHEGQTEYDQPWGEQPAQAEGDHPNYIYKTYYTTLGNGRWVRNYSVCFDIETKVSRWVAYPLHTIYTSNRNYTTYPSTTKGRTNAWAFDDAVTEYFGDTNNYNTAYSFISTYDAQLDAYDTWTEPIIEQKYQQNVATLQADGSPYQSGGAYGDSEVRDLNRGHMLPSASRYGSWETNAQTFYATNMMPQNYSFNQGSWETIEDGARKSICSDTLYVVVGTLFEPGQRITSRGRNVTIPSHSYKLLLRTRDGNTKKYIGDIKSADDLICIGFVYENNDSSANLRPAEAAVSVAEIEKRAGFTFFKNIDPAIADEVKAKCDISDWPWIK